MADYRETISQLRRESAEQQVAQIQEDIQYQDQRRKEYEQAAIAALESGDKEGARWHAEQMGQVESEMLALSNQLAQVSASIPQELSLAKQDWIASRSDLASDPRYVELAGRAHTYITKNMGVTEDSDEYFELMRHAVEPGGDYQPAWTPDDVCKALNLESSTYNQNLEKLWSLKKSGSYPDS